MPTDSGIGLTVNREFNQSADATSGLTITSTPSADNHILVYDLIISVDTAMNITLRTVTSNSILGLYYMPANSVIQITPRGGIFAEEQGEALEVVTSVAGNISTYIIWD